MIKKVFSGQKITLLLIILAVLFISCKKQEPAVYNFAPEESKRLTVYSAIDTEQTLLITEEFEKVTGIWVKNYTGSAPQIYEQISEDDDADVILCYASDAISLFNELLAPYVKNNSLVPRPFGKKNLAAFAVSQTCLFYNKIYFESIPEENLIFSIKSNRLLAMLNPYISDENYTCLYYLFSSTPISSINNFSITFDKANLACESTAEGYCSAVIVPENFARVFESTHTSKRTSFIVPENPCYIVETASILKICKNKDNADRFIAFLQNLGTQSFLSQTLKFHPVRKDMELSEEDKRIIANAIVNGFGTTESQLKNKSEFFQQWIKRTVENDKIKYGVTFFKSFVKAKTCSGFLCFWNDSNDTKSYYYCLYI